MNRGFVHSDYHAGEVSVLDWVITTILLLTGLWMLLITNNTTVGVLALVAGLSFGFFLTVAALGKLNDSP